MDSIVLAVLVRTMVAGTPLLLGTVGEVLTERSGILNFGIEGMMSLGAVSAFMVTLNTGNPWLGLLAAVLAGTLGGLLHAVVTVSLQSTQVVSGLALTMLGLGVSGFLGKPFIGIPLEVRMTPVAIPLLSRIPALGDILFNQSPIFYLAVLLGILSWFMLKYTRWGVIIRTVGENPQAAETAGINVSLVRYLCVMAGGAFSGLAGAHLSLAYSKSWIEGMTGGRGWIVVALTIFALWNPMRAFLGAFLFGGIFVLQYMLQPLGISPYFLAMFPYIATLAVLFVIAAGKDSRKVHAPASLGEIYRRGER